MTEETRMMEGGLASPTPLASKPFSSVLFFHLTDSLSQTILFPFAAVMVKSFNVTDNPAKLGYFAGFLASSLYAGSLISSSFWGALSDRVGRKPVLMVGMLINAACALLFGSSRSLPVAMAARFVSGLFSTVGATGRSVISELCDETNQAEGFSVIALTYGVGHTLGPAMGGFLSLPAQKYSLLFPPGSLFDNYPFLLPCLTLAILILIGAIITFVFLPETLKRSKGDTNSTDKEKCDISEDNGLSQPLVGHRSSQEIEDESHIRSGPTLLNVLLSRDTVLSTLLFCVLSFQSTAFNEVFPLWCITPQNLGGLSLNTNQIGVLQAAVGIASIPMQMLVYTPLVNRMGAARTFQVAATVGMLHLFFPFVKAFQSDPVLLQSAMFVFMLLRSFPQCMFTSVFILMSNGVRDPRYLGAVNGISHTLSMAFRTLSPAAAGSFFAWTTGHGGTVLNSDSWFTALASLYAAMLFLPFFFTRYANSRSMS